VPAIRAIHQEQKTTLVIAPAVSTRENFSTWHQINKIPFFPSPPIVCSLSIRCKIYKKKRSFFPLCQQLVVFDIYCKAHMGGGGRKKEKQYQQWTSDVFKREKKKGE
jgi:hypothetical protein